MLYSSSDPVDRDQVIDPNSYLPFKLVDSIIVTRIMKEMDDLGDLQEEGYSPVERSISSTHGLAAPTSLVGALTKALCCKKSGIDDSVYPLIHDFARRQPYHNLVAAYRYKQIG